MEQKDEAVVEEETRNLCTHIKELTDTVSQLLCKNKWLNCDLAI